MSTMTHQQTEEASTAGGEAQFVRVSDVAELGIRTWVCGAAISCRFLMERTHRCNHDDKPRFQRAERAAITEERG